MEAMSWLSIYVAYLATTSLLIACIEMMIKHNEVAQGDNQWTFGQTLAIFLLFKDISDIYKYGIQNSPESG